MFSDLIIVISRTFCVATGRVLLLLLYIQWLHFFCAGTVTCIKWVPFYGTVYCSKLIICTANTQSKSYYFMYMLVRFTCTFFLWPFSAVCVNVFVCVCFFCFDFFTCPFNLYLIETNVFRLKDYNVGVFTFDWLLIIGSEKSVSICNAYNLLLSLCVIVIVCCSFFFSLLSF